MELQGKVAVVTGGSSGIGAALVQRFTAEGAEAVVVADLAPPVSGPFVRTDVSNEAEVAALVRQVEADHGRVDLFCSNAGIGGGGGIEAPDEVWDQTFRVNLMAHVYAARAVLPGMLARGEGYLLNTASAAGLLTNLGNATYTVSKHGTVAFAEYLAITYGGRGIGVSCLCPQGVRTPMLLGGLDENDPAAAMVLASGDMIEPEDVAEAVVAGLRDERFLILPHPQVAEFYRRKAEDPDRWLRGMRRIQAQLSGG
jgi:NAD(P)-dependent dehydrogenase (short-subunit alcohol dehydrogenase family)